ncbi:hypothetical protein O3M35_011879 [Rhynocoris fuscipes]|uniref:Major facilitator superfamily (MFS) profile domain-containing protein n=1 Tax=Rhynocoris fuscipes TaxID=488301 RepID=A0AAW1D0G8_9HEMI
MDTEELEKILEEKSRNYCWLFTLFILASTPGIFNSMHITSYVFLSDNPKFWCDIAVLRNANWTDEQIRNVSAVNPQAVENCLMYDWDYENFKKIGYEEAIKYIENNEKPSQVACTSYRYQEEKPSIVSEWDLVCGSSALKPVSQALVPIGKVAGGLIFGIFCDKYGRKKGFIISCVMYMIASTIAGVTHFYSIFLILRFIIGVAGSGVYSAGFTILTEMTVKRWRTWLGVVYNISYSFGYIILPIFAYFSSDWRQLQYYMCIPSYLLIINCWLLPESARWLITEGRYEEAKKTVYGKRFRRPTDAEPKRPVPAHNTNMQSDERHRFWDICSVPMKLFQLFTYWESTKRILICYFGWFVAAFYYLLIVMNGRNFSANKYLYVALNGLVEAPAYIMPVLILSYIGRKLSTSVIFIISGLALLIILLLEDATAVMIVALVGRFCMSAVFAILILYTSELFPTSNRNSAVGSSLTVDQIGAILAPYIVDLGISIVWYLPSTVAGVLSTTTGLLIFMLPETRNKPLLDLLEDMKGISSRDKVSCLNCCTFT